MSTVTRIKRRRSAIACRACHDRKVRCNIALRGVPCSNCETDLQPCEIYGRPRPTIADSSRPIRPRTTKPLTPSTNAYPLTPSTSSAHVTESYNESPDHRQTPSDRSVSDSPPDHPRSRNVTLLDEDRSHGLQASTVPVQAPPSALHTVDHDREKSEKADRVLVPFFAGDSEGLEFLFDVCYPARAVKANHYIVNRDRLRRDHLRQRPLGVPQPLPETEVVCELLRCYFQYVHPFLPILNISEVLLKAASNDEHVGSLLMYSIFLAAASYVEPSTLERAGFSSRKSMKQYFYQRAKEIYDAQIETDKTTLIQSALLLAFWYVDLEDQDGSSYWVGIAISLSYTIGLHRQAPYDRMPGCPVSKSQMIIWRRMFWSMYTRDAWLALALGRPMRMHLDDCDVPMPSLEDVVYDMQQLTADQRSTFVPVDAEYLAERWLDYLRLTTKIENVLTLHYKPRRPSLSVAQLQHDYEEVKQMRDNVLSDTDFGTSASRIHSCCFKCYANSIIIAQHRPYVTKAPEYLPPSQQQELQSLALQRVKSAAASTTYILNDLVSTNLIELSPISLTTAMMSAMQIHLYEYHKSTGLSRQYAYHHLNLHMIIISHLRKTYWSADHQYKLFHEALKAMDAGSCTGPVVEDPSETRASAEAASSRRASPPKLGDHDLATPPPPPPGGTTTCLMSGGLDDFFVSFNPFVNFTPDFETTTPADWAIGSNALYGVQGTP